MERGSNIKILGQANFHDVYQTRLDVWEMFARCEIG